MNKNKLRHDSLRFADLPDWVRPIDAVRFLTISRSAMYELLRCQAIPSRRFGRTIRIPKDALDPRVKETAKI